MKKIKSLAIAIPVVAASVLMFAGTAQATEEGYYPEVGWKLEDTDATFYNCEINPPTDRTPASNSKIVNATTVDLEAKGTPAPPNYGTSIETSNLNLDVSSGDTVTVHYALAGANPAAEAIRMFIYDHPNGDTDCEGPTQKAVVPTDSGTNGVLTIGINFTGKIGTFGLVYDSSNGEADGKVRFSGVKVNDTTVLFLEPEPEPSAEPSVEPSAEPSETPSSSAPPVSTGGNLPITGMNIAAMGTAGAGFIGVGLVALLWGMHRRRETE